MKQGGFSSMNSFPKATGVYFPCNVTERFPAERIMVTSRRRITLIRGQLLSALNVGSKHRSASRALKSSIRTFSYSTL